MRDILPHDIVSATWAPFLSAAAHLVILAVLFAIPTQLERDRLDADLA